MKYGAESISGCTICGTGTWAPEGNGETCTGMSGTSLVALQLPICSFAHVSYDDPRITATHAAKPLTLTLQHPPPLLLIIIC